MKLKNIIQRMGRTQNRVRMINAHAGIFITILQSPFRTKFIVPFKGLREVLNIFLIQNKGKGPPGRAVGPGGGYCLLPDNQHTACIGRKIIIYQLPIINYFLPIIHN